VAAGLAERLAPFKSAEMISRSSRNVVRLVCGKSYRSVGDAREIFDNLVLGAARLTVNERRSALATASRKEDPLKWAAAQNDLGTVLKALAELEQGTKSVDDLSEAISAYGNRTSNQFE
jgi:hypothetical protein